MPPPKIIAGRYEVIRELGRGGMGVVYLVHHVHTHEQLALKLLSTHVEAKLEVIERFRREMRAPALIKSDNVVKITDADVAAELDGAPFYVMEYLVGCDLAHVLKLRGKLDAEETVWILTQVARGLDKAHQLGIVHRDLKPENVFVHRREDGSLVVKIFDFGLVRFTQQLGSRSENRPLTNTQSMLGTPLYMAPEQATGGDANVPIGPPADIWAIGMLCYELLTGKTYFGWDTIMQFVGQLLFSELAPPSSKDPSLPLAFDAWFARACQRKPDARFASVGTQVAELAQALGCSTAELSETAPAALRQTIADSRDQTQRVTELPAGMPLPPPAEVSEIGEVPTRLSPSTEDPSLGKVPTINVPKPQTLGDTPTVMKVSPRVPTIGNSQTQFQPVPPNPAEPLAVQAPPRRGRRLFFFAAVVAGLLGLSFFLLPTLSSTQRRRPDSPVDLSAAPKPEAKPEPKADTSSAVRPERPVAPPPDLASPVETLLPIPSSPPPRKIWKPIAPGKRIMRPVDKSAPAQPPVKPKPPEEYVHPTL